MLILYVTDKTEVSEPPAASPFQMPTCTLQGILLTLLSHKTVDEEYLNRGNYIIGILLHGIGQGVAGVCF